MKENNLTCRRCQLIGHEFVMTCPNNIFRTQNGIMHQAAAAVAMCVLNTIVQAIHAAPCYPEPPPVRNGLLHVQM